VVEQPLLQMGATSKSGQRSIRAKQAMAWDNQWNLVGCICAPNSTRSLWTAKLEGKGPIGRMRPKRNTNQCLPNLDLPRGATPCQGNIKGYTLTTPIFLDLAPSLIGLPLGTMQGISSPLQFFGK
jgi:hypothetical protein